MKSKKLYALMLIVALALFACSNDKDSGNSGNPLADSTFRRSIMGVYDDLVFGSGNTVTIIPDGRENFTATYARDGRRVTLTQTSGSAADWQSIFGAATHLELSSDNDSLQLMLNSTSIPFGTFRRQ
ncbi:MAG: hypothetical protein FWE37_09450 [Spirochaetaceae bacterium]|nr:hypothetical protein [Spirochaetaceae bacterium]